MKKEDFLRFFYENGYKYFYYSLEDFGKRIGFDVNLLPISCKIILENLIRNQKESVITFEGIDLVVKHFSENSSSPLEIPFYPARVILQDFTGVPVVVDLAAMRDVIARWGGDPSIINPSIPVHLVIDHSLQVDSWASPEAFRINLEKEFERNKERYSFLKWAQASFSNFFVIPPGKGIIHQINLENLATIVFTKPFSEGYVIYPDTVMGTDSHTTMINSIGILGWGIGGIEAEAVIVGEPYYFPIQDVVGVHLVGNLRGKTTATDVALFITERLRKHNVVNKIVEFFGSGAESLSVQDRSVIANMAPEYGATMGYFPVDDRTLRFFAETGRSPELLKLVEKYTKLQGLFGSYKEPSKILFKEIIEIDLSEVVPSVAGPKRPQDRRALDELVNFVDFLKKPKTSHDGYGLGEEELDKKVPFGDKEFLTHGSVVLASITSCTNTSNPALIITAGLLAKRAVHLGLKPKPWVKTSFTPGSRAVRSYLERLGLLKELEALGFHIVGYGCATCIGNSGPLPEDVQRAIKENNLVVCAVISANRNFEGRVHNAVRANFLASPPLVVAYALAGRINIDWQKEPIGLSSDGKPVFLKDLWPSEGEIKEALERADLELAYKDLGKGLFEGDALWESLEAKSSKLFNWDKNSTYLRVPSFLENLSLEPQEVKDIEGARVLLLLGDSVTTDHISPAGGIPENSPAGKYLKSLGVKPEDFNSYGSRRGNHEVMVRGTFANIRLKNKLVEPKVGGITLYFPEEEELTVWEASERYRAQGVPLIIVAGKEYGTGSSRDWAAKGTALLGVKAVIAESFERIHRSNLVGMGVLPLQFLDGYSAEKLGIDGREVFYIRGLGKSLKPGSILEVEAVRPSGEVLKFPVLCRLDTNVEVQYFLNGGILPVVLRNLMSSNRS